MKKLLLIVFMFMQFSVFASGSKESWASYGGGYGHMIETQTISNVKVNSTLNSAGLNLNVIEFKDGKDTGFFANDSFNILLDEQISAGGMSFGYSFSEADFKSYIGLLFGPIYRNKLDNEKTFYYGFGPSIQEIAVVFPSGDGSLSLLFGLGANIGMKMNIDEKTYWDIGVVSNASFYSWNMSNSNQDGSFDSLFNLSLNPHIGIGFVRNISN